MATYYHYHNTPIGELLLAGDGELLALLGFPSGKIHQRPGIPFLGINFDDWIFCADLLNFFWGKGNRFKIFYIFLHKVQGGMEQEGSREKH